MLVKFIILSPELSIHGNKLSVSIDNEILQRHFRETWSRRCYKITQVIVTSCYIANSNFKFLLAKRQVKNLKGMFRIVSDGKRMQ
ncbi:hypothetical protein C3709_02150 [Lelliottia aquatilis]|uniref:Uncharacterized protein n=1 Tax=Lelliottia aquatilis TaxID=2080838 RepID=A0ABX5A7R7_9ENTR|nr:hypothetical protein C3711_10290 [Lelliottia aquatilis]POZ33934.1 hypothetical protein C3712_02150 [Lelliottia aquatilis]POZ34468.1 hypothetical protein C3708_02150 [Lelliottia sp. 7254-16]POZ35002.1 hypothetical protein C3710_06140 [Lelliottia aquatilis]POZ40254.1 hypothetical protein C3709_02150 [Lelliottia aquatilis]